MILYSLPHQSFFEQNKFQESVRISEMGARQLLKGKKQPSLPDGNAFA
jgi:hypothetical protein